MWPGGALSVAGDTMAGHDEASAIVPALCRRARPRPDGPAVAPTEKGQLHRDTTSSTLSCTISR